MAEETNANASDLETGDDRHKKEKQCTPAKCKSCCKSFTAFLFSTLGLVIMVVAYSIAGGFLFQMLEAEKEREQIGIGRQKAKEATTLLLDNLWNLTQDKPFLEYQNWTSTIEPGILKEYQKQLYVAVTIFKWDGRQNDEEEELKWNFAGALLYAVTAITTIGYGHVTPSTVWGMMSTILYCVFGLPLTLMCIANVGKFFARVFKILYHTLFCGICCVCCLEYRKNKLERLIEMERMGVVGVEKIAEQDEGRNVALELMGQETAIGASVESLQRKIALNLSKAQVWLRNVKKRFSHSMNDDVTVPVYLCLVVMGGYIIGGASMFKVYEEWEFHQSAYFCFVTLTTIGFGDFVPGVTNLKAGDLNEDSTPRLVLTTIYVFVGLALVGMCIDLMQADVVQKVLWVARKIGAKKKDKDPVSRENSKASKSFKSKKAESDPSDVSFINESFASAEKHNPKRSRNKNGGVRNNLSFGSSNNEDERCFIELEEEDLTSKRSSKKRKGADLRQLTRQLSEIDPAHNLEKQQDSKSHNSSIQPKKLQLEKEPAKESKQPYVILHDKDTPPRPKRSVLPQKSFKGSIDMRPTVSSRVGSLTAPMHKSKPKSKNEPKPDSQPLIYPSTTKAATDKSSPNKGTTQNQSEYTTPPPSIVSEHGEEQLEVSEATSSHNTTQDDQTNQSFMGSQPDLNINASNNNNNNGLDDASQSLSSSSSIWDDAREHFEEEGQMWDTENNGVPKESVFTNEAFIQSVTGSLDFNLKASNDTDLNAQLDEDIKDTNIIITRDSLSEEKEDSSDADSLTRVPLMQNSNS